MKKYKNFVTEAGRCWPGHKPVPGKKPFSPGSCVKEEVIQEGRPSQRHPLEGHDYHKKTDAELTYIAKDAHKAAEAMKSHNTTAENKYRDQANDSATVRYWRQKNGMPDWYKKKYGHIKEEVEQLDELSKDTLSSYVDKATDSARTMPGYGTKNEPGKKSKRMAAISVATSRIKKTNEEVEQLDELSRGTLTSYATSAGQSLGGAVATIGKAKQISKFYAKKTSPEEVKKDAIHRAGKRMFGLGRAASRLAKEEVQIDEREMTGGEMKNREKIVKSMKKGMQGFKDRYGDKAKNVMYATATKQAMKD